jgi:hypothetical protein
MHAVSWMEQHLDLVAALEGQQAVMHSPAGKQTKSSMVSFAVWQLISEEVAASCP